MLRKALLTAGATFAVTLSTSVFGQVSKQEKQAIAMSPSQVAAVAEVKGLKDDLDPSVWISTEPFLKRKGNADKFLRANIDKITGEVFYQLYLRGSWSTRLSFDRATLMIDDRLQSAPVRQVWADVSCSRYGCTYYQDFAVDFSREQLETLCKESDDIDLRVRLFGQSVDGVNIVFLRNEAEGLLLAVDTVLEQVQIDQR